jgi:hypothetical protein
VNWLILKIVKKTDIGSNLTSYTNGNSPEDVLKFEEMVNAVTAKDLQNINNTKDKVIGMLMPRKIIFFSLN